MSMKSDEATNCHATRQRLLIALVQVLGLATWFSASAIAPSLVEEWDLSPSSAVWLTASTQLGFVIGAVLSAVLNLADRFPPHLLLATSGIGAALTTLVFSLWASSLLPAVGLRLLTGIFLAGVYPVGMKLMASWATGNARGRAMGLLIGALTLGSAMPHLIGTIDVEWRWLMAFAAFATVVGALIAAVLIRPGPYLKYSRFTPRPKYVVEVFTDRRARLVNFGYLGHMWELYALWTWFPIFVAHSQGSVGVSASVLSLVMFVLIGVSGFAGAMIGGAVADRWGRTRAAAGALVVSGACCVLSPLAFEWGPVALVIFGVVWGASVIADSGVFSTLLSEVVDEEHAGTALTAQTAAGFLLTVVSIQLVAVFAEAWGWQFALSILVIGPILGVVSMARFGRIGARGSA